MSLRDAHPGTGRRAVSVAGDPSPLAAGTDGGGVGWSSPPKGCPLETTNATKRRTAANAVAVRLTRSPQTFFSPTITGSCSAATFCCASPQRHRTLWAPSQSRSQCHRFVRGRRHVTSAPRAPVAASCRTGSIRAVLSASRSSRTVWSTVPTRRTTSSPGPRARTASCSAGSCCCPGWRGGGKSPTATVSRIYSRGVVRRQIEPNGVVNRACVANHLAPVRPHRFVRCSAR